MIDLHNHILPQLDDGARDLDEALAMAKAAVGIGTTVLAATPHRFMRGREIVPTVIIERVTKLQAEFDARGIALKLIPGSEIPMGSDVLSKLRDGNLLRYGGISGTHALIETPFEALPHTGIALLDSLLTEGITPILAHPERNFEIQQDLAFVETVASSGTWIQITSGSVLGHFGPAAEATAKAILAHGEWKIILASDAHWAHDRTVSHLREAADRVAVWFGDAERADWMVESGPASCVPAQYL